VDLRHLKMQRAFGGLALLVSITVPVALQQTPAAPLVVVPAQELGHFKFASFLDHELSSQALVFGGTGHGHYFHAKVRG